MMLSRTTLVTATALAFFATLVPLPALVSACVLLAFLVVVPGAVCCRLLGFDATGAFGWTIVLGTSLALDTLFNELLMFAHLWTPTIASLATIALVSIGLVVEHRQHRTHESPALGGPSAR
jgi:hypothetical protein